MGAAFNELMYGARELAFRAQENTERSAARELVIESPFERKADSP